MSPSKPAVKNPVKSNSGPATRGVGDAADCDPYESSALAGSSPVSACCPGSAGRSRKASTKLLVGQEPSRKELALC